MVLNPKLDLRKWEGLVTAKARARWCSDWVSSGLRSNPEGHVEDQQQELRIFEIKARIFPITRSSSHSSTSDCHLGVMLGYIVFIRRDISLSRFRGQRHRAMEGLRHLNKL